jgi:ATP synthase protein I
MEFQRGTRAALMQTDPSQRGEMSQDSLGVPLHPEVVSPGRKPAIDPAARRGKRAFDTLSASSVGLELGLSVIIGLLVGYFLDSRYGTTPWLMLLFLGFGLAAGFRGVVRAVARFDRAAARDAREGHGG